MPTTLLGAVWPIEGTPEHVVEQVADQIRSGLLVLEGNFRGLESQILRDLEEKS